MQNECNYLIYGKKQILIINIINFAICYINEHIAKKYNFSRFYFERKINLYIFTLRIRTYLAYLICEKIRKLLFQNIPMSKLIFPLILSLLVIWLGVATWWFNFKYNQLDTYGNPKCEVPFTILDGNFQTKSDNSITFEYSDWEPVIPLQALSSLKSVALYLANNSKKKLILTGRFGIDELNDSDFPNNGVARAEAIKKELVTYGAPGKLIEVKADSLAEINLICGKIMTGLEFNFETQDEIVQVNSVGKIKRNKTGLNTPINEIDTILKNESNFQENKTYIIFYRENTFKPEIDEKVDIYLKSLAKYLKENPKYRLLLMGHTDNIGDESKHFNFGKYRARKLRDVLLNYQIEKRRIKTDSQGSSAPIGSNNSLAGRTKNRRVEISIIKR
jgi:OOP family OmpA-OmpF porin